MQCPSCDNPCDSESYEGVTIEVCPKCKGVWLEKGELEQISKNKGMAFKTNEVEAINRLCGVSGAPSEVESRNMKCPKCAKEPMKTFNYNYSSGVIVDRCLQGCGIWLDADELEKVQIHSELWQDKLEANRKRFASLAAQVEENTRATIEQIEQAVAPSRFRFVNAVVRGLVRFS